MQTPTPASSASVMVSASEWAMWISAYRAEAFSIASPIPAALAWSTQGAIASQKQSAASSQREPAVAAGQHVDGAGAQRGGDIDQARQRFARFPPLVAVRAEVARPEDMRDGLHRDVPPRSAARASASPPGAISAGLMKPIRRAPDNRHWRT